MESEGRLIEACRTLFGPEVVISWDFVGYMQKEGVLSAFRRQAMILHPDRHQAYVGDSLPDLARGVDGFIQLCESRDILLKYIQQRGAAGAVQANCQRQRYQNGTSTYRSFQGGCAIHRNTVSDPASERVLFGRFLYRLGLITWPQLLAALTWQKGTRPKIGELGVAQGYISKELIGPILRHSSAQRAFGKTAIAMGKMTEAEVKALLQRQKILQKKIGQYFVEHKILSHQEIRDCLQDWYLHNKRL